MSIKLFGSCGAQSLMNTIRAGEYFGKCSKDRRPTSLFSQLKVWQSRGVQVVGQIWYPFNEGCDGAW
jgi:hypothetical protein